MSQRSHWERIYATRPSDRLGWYRPQLETSLAWIAELGLGSDAPIIDVGAGASTLVDDLLRAGYRRVTALDIAATALAVSRKRLGQRSREVTWLNADIRSADLPRGHYELWHDRAVFHFLTAPADRRRYLDQLRHALKPRGYLIVGAFTPAAPPQCSGLPVQRYTADTLRAELGAEFALQRQTEQVHRTPGGVEQQYLYCEFRRN